MKHFFSQAVSDLICFQACLDPDMSCAVLSNVTCFMCYFCPVWLHFYSYFPIVLFSVILCYGVVRDQSLMKVTGLFSLI